MISLYCSSVPNPSAPAGPCAPSVPAAPTSPLGPAGPCGRVSPLAPLGPSSHAPPLARRTTLATPPVFTDSATYPKHSPATTTPFSPTSTLAPAVKSLPHSTSHTGISLIVTDTSLSAFNSPVDLKSGVSPAGVTAMVKTSSPSRVSVFSDNKRLPGTSSVTIAVKFAIILQHLRQRLRLDESHQTPLGIKRRG